MNCNHCGKQINKGGTLCSNCASGTSPDIGYRDLSQNQIITVPETEMTFKKLKIAGVVLSFVFIAGSFVSLFLGFPLGVFGVIACFIGASITYNISGLKSDGARNHVKFLRNQVTKQPKIIEYFGIQNVDYILPLPTTMIGRILKKTLPSDFDKSSFEVYEYDEISMSFGQMLANKFKTTGGRGLLQGRENISLFNLANPKEELISYFEPTAAKKYIYRALANMEAYLGISDSSKFDTIKSTLDEFYFIAQNADRIVYFTDNAFVDLSFVKKELIRICDALHINYDAMGLGDYRAARSTWMATGSKALVGFAITATALSHIGAKMDESLFKDASVYYALNNIIYYFNNQYCANSAEWQKYRAEHPMDQMDIL